MSKKVGVYKKAMREYEKRILETALENFNFNKSATARYFGMKEQTLRSRLKKLKIKAKATT